MPRRRHGRGFGITIVDDPAPLETEHPVDLAAARAEITIAELVFAHRLAIHPRPELGAECLRIPPGEQLEQETFHRRHALKTIGTLAFCHLSAPKSSRSSLRDIIRPLSHQCY